jgi:glycerol-3-phosphate acyltransferase PlsX
MRVAFDAAVVNRVEGSPSGDLRTMLEAALGECRRSGYSLLVCGKQEAVAAELRGLSAPEDGTVSVLDAPSVISTEEDPVAACREKADSSVMRACEALAKGDVQAMVSTSGCGATVAAGSWHLKRLSGVLRPALSQFIATSKGSCLVVDAGANLDAKPWHLLQFALMGSIYLEHACGVQRPSVGLLAPKSEGSETTDLVRETSPLLKYAGLNYIGPLDAGAVSQGAADVVVADGASGDLVVRLHEGLSRAYFEMLESERDGSLLGRLGAALSGAAIDRVSRRLSGPADAGAPILGLGGAVVSCRAPNSAGSVAGSIRTAVALAESDVRKRVKDRLEDIKSDMEFVRAI